MRRINDSIYLSDKQDYTKLTKKSRRVGNRIYESYYYDANIVELKTISRRVGNRTYSSYYYDYKDSIKENCETISPIHTNIPVTLVVS